MHGNDKGKGSYDSAAWREANKHKPGGGPVMNKDESKRDVYSGSNPKMFQPYTYKGPEIKAPDSKVQNNSASKGSQSSSFKR